MHTSRSTRISDCLSWHHVLLKLPGSSPLEELTAIEDTKRILGRLLKNIAGAEIHQPISDAAESLSEQFRLMRDIFQRQPASNSNILAVPPGFPPLGVQLSPSAGTTVPLHRVSSAPATVPPAQLQRVPATTIPTVPLLQFRG